VITSVCWENNKPTELLHITVIEKKVAINQQVLGRHRPDRKLKIAGGGGGIQRYSKVIS
jgi:hypothetical protein